MDTRYTPSQRLATLSLGQPVEHWLAARRAEGASWRDIAKQLRQQTQGHVDVSHEAIRQWHETSVERGAA
jgi:uncharacterized protein YfiM (DUF2279 family)